MPPLISDYRWVPPTPLFKTYLLWWIEWNIGLMLAWGFYRMGASWHMSIWFSSHFLPIIWVPWSCPRRWSRQLTAPRHCLSAKDDLNHRHNSLAASHLVCWPNNVAFVFWTLNCRMRPFSPNTLTSSILSTTPWWTSCAMWQSHYSTSATQAIGRQGSLAARNLRAFLASSRYHELHARFRLFHPFWET